jgi:tRNA pseudouridine38-40 synthase
MRNVKLTIEYDGTLYHGWQVQLGVTTVQGILQDRLSRILGHPVSIYGAGRTDAGVHAKGQVANFHTHSNLPADGLRRALNASVPSDIVIRQAEEVPPSFHAQFDARGKEYHYYLLNQPDRSAFHLRYALLVKGPLDLDQMRESLAQIKGKHDFFALSTASEDKESTVRTINKAELVQKEGFLVIVIQGNGFLHKMVRRIVGTLIEVGRRKISCAQIAEILKSRDKSLGGPSAPPHGLFLMSVHY